MSSSVFLLLSYMSNKSIGGNDGDCFLINLCCNDYVIKMMMYQNQRWVNSVQSINPSLFSCINICYCCKKKWAWFNVILWYQNLTCTFVVDCCCFCAIWISSFDIGVYVNTYICVSGEWIIVMFVCFWHVHT